MTNLNPEAIGQAIAEEGIYDSAGYLSTPAYELVTDAVPIVCVDVIPVDITQSGLVRIGIITRATGPEKDKPAIVGGRIQKNETISTAVGRHLYDSFQDRHFVFHEGNSEDRPFYLAQFEHAPVSARHFDPTKHAITLTYLIDIPEPQIAQNEALDFRWIELDEIPTESAYNHHLTMQRAADFLQKQD